ncbi:DUF1553 domain-containing protein [Verrucomicrobium spinosum]|uniref:DUF1553 domain-containing protein n=1 Tax=Verrucomicrobium spinosum TaxID=2736 RepID=UPI00017445DC|nr:DUF1553 domain-containing protein [Verrucomicrobium spinosum]
MSSARPAPLCRLLPLALLGAPVLALAEENPHGDVFKNQPVPAVVDFNKDVRPIISAKCYHCHGADEGSRKAKLRLDLRDEAIKDRDGVHAIKPGDAGASDIMARILTTDPDEVMPPPKEGHALTSREIEVMKKWINQGAPYAEHWAFQKPVKPTPPSAVVAPVDAFVQKHLKAQGLAPAPEADRHTLIRRLALDLTGLPPSPAEVKRFVEDQRPDAYERMVDHYLAQPAYGERWARVWLDLARYADSAGYGSDPLRLNIWPYRDWVINAFNRNQPYDQFTRDQLAGDLLKNPTQEQLIATAFHRNTMTNTEGGTDDEEFRVAAVKDRIGTTMQVWMGLTLGCAQCHTHKFDPITQQEYYEFFAIFNQTADNDKADETPTLAVADPAQRKRMEKLQKEILALETQLKAPAPPALTEELAAWEATMKQPTRWQPVELTAARSEKGAPLAKQPDHSLLAGAVVSDTHLLEAVVPGGITGIRVEALPDDRLPGKGPGHSGAGNFVLSELKVSAEPAMPEKSRPKARFVRVTLPGKSRILHLAEVQVFSAGRNLAPTGLATQSSTGFEGSAKLAADGNTDGDYAKKSVSHCSQQDDPWWEVDLKQEVPVDSIVVWNRTDGNTGSRTAGFQVVALDAGRKEVFHRDEASAPQPSTTLPVGGPVDIRFKEATADFEQNGFTVAQAIDGKPDSGWGVSPQLGQAHTAQFVTSAPVGTKGTPTRLQISLAQLHGSKHVLGRYRLSITTDPTPQPVMPARIQDLLAIPSANRDAKSQAELLDWYKDRSGVYARIRTDLEKKQNEMQTAGKPVPLPVMKDLEAGKQRQSHFLVKGNFLNPGDPVQPALLKSFNPAPASSRINRLAVAEWLMSRENPLTARVTVNRFWAQLFGRGIVETEEDFGTQGTLPSNPELLDWLAVEFMDLNWDVKALLKTMIMSSTYRQSSKPSELARTKDPRNVLLSHYQRRRLDAEQVRDQALTLSGLMSHKLGGPSVFPPQPDGLWRAAFNGQRTWETSNGEDRYRRGLYTFWRRTVPYPSMATFDAPSRENATLRRLPTNTPLQAFVTLNDPAYFEMAQSLGRRLIREGGTTPEARIRYGLELSLVRPASAEQITALLDFHRDELAHLKSAPADAARLAGEIPAGSDPAEAAVWTMVANVLLNLDGVLTKG